MLLLQIAIQKQNVFTREIFHGSAKKQSLLEKLVVAVF